MGQRPPDRRLPPDHPDRDPGGATRRPALAPSAPDRLRPRPSRGLLRAPVRGQCDDDHHPRGAPGRRDRVLPAGGVRRDAEPRRRRQATGRDLAAADGREPDLDGRPRGRRHHPRRAGPRPGLLAELGHVRGLRAAARPDPGRTTAGRPRREPRSLGRRRRRLSDRRALARAPDGARRLERRHARRRRDQRRRGRAREGLARRRQYRLRHPPRGERARAGVGSFVTGSFVDRLGIGRVYFYGIATMAGGYAIATIA